MVYLKSQDSQNLWQSLGPAPKPLFYCSSPKSNARRHLKLCEGCGAHASYAQCQVPRFTFLLCFAFCVALRRIGVWSSEGELGVHNLWHLARFVIRQIEMLFICRTCAPPSSSWWRQMRQRRRRARLISGRGSSPPTQAQSLPLSRFSVLCSVIRFSRVYKLRPSQKPGWREHNLY